MQMKLKFTKEALKNLKALKANSAQNGRLKQVLKALGFMETNLKHTGLCTHKYDSLSGPNGEEVFEAYAQNQTPGAYRVFWFYGPDKREITVIAITPHP